MLLPVLPRMGRVMSDVVKWYEGNGFHYGWAHSFLSHVMPDPAL